MKTRKVTDLIHFGDEAARSEVLVETPKLWSQVICLQGTQDHGPVADREADGLLVVLAGEIAAQVGRGRARMKQWESVTVPAGEELTVRNASEDPSVVLLVLSPPPS
jgi:glyoxylate utilization-related uncharacterized protein